MRLRAQHIISATALLFLGFAPALAQGGRGVDGANNRTYTGDRMVYELKGGVATLYSRDPFAATLCFTDGGDGFILERGEVRNRCSHLRIENHNLEAIGSQEQIAIGVQGGQYGLLLDLGEENQLSRKYGYLTWPGLAFNSIRLSEGKVLILKNRERNEFEELKEAAPLLQATSAQARASEPRPIEVGHVYLGRILDRNDKSLSLLVKILVLAHTPGQSVTIRWQLL